MKKSLKKGREAISGGTVFVRAFLYSPIGEKFASIRFRRPYAGGDVYNNAAIPDGVKQVFCAVFAV
ncbi:MAG: hypothetical protein LBQ88_05090 [Treponema sp.]|nr:hypothetical protein [Treponema sp.]